MSRLLLIATLLATAFCARGDEAPAPAKRVVLCPITGEVGDGTAVIVKRAIAHAKGADLLVFMLDTPGGLLDAAIDITDAVRHAPCKTVAYLHGMGGISAGALISYSCDDIVMATGTNIGASTPVTIGGEMPAAMSEKTMSYLRSKYRSLGEDKGHDPYLGEAMVDAAVELRGYRDEAGKYRIVRVRGPEAAVGDAGPTPPTGVAETIRSLTKEMFGVDPPVREKHQADGGETTASVEQPFPALPDGAELIDPAGELLTLTTLEAQKVGLSKATVASIDEALALYDLAGATREMIDPTVAERFYIWLTSPIIAGLLLMIGLAGIYAEIKAPGFGLPGVAGLVCLSLFFGAHLVLGLAEWIDVVLVLLGIGLIVAEIFVIPGTTVAGAAGFASIVAGIYLSLTRVPIPQYSFEFERLGGAVTTGSVTLFSLLAFIVLTWKLLPKTPLPRLMVQNATQPQAAGYTVQTAADEVEYLGAEGVTLSMLRPAGRARVHGHALDVVTQGEFIEEGKAVRVVRVDGNRYVVKES